MRRARVPRVRCDGEGIVQRTNGDVRIAGIERCSVTKIRRLTACRFESGPGHHGYVSACADVFRRTPPDHGLAGFFVSFQTDLVLRQPVVRGGICGCIRGAAALVRQVLVRLPCDLRAQTRADIIGAPRRSAAGRMAAGQPGKRRVALVSETETGKGTGIAFPSGRS